MVLLFCIFHHQVATAAGLNITTEYCHIVWLSYNCYRCHFPEGRNFLRFFAKSPHPSFHPHFQSLRHFPGSTIFQHVLSLPLSLFNIRFIPNIPGWILSPLVLSFPQKTILPTREALLQDFHLAWVSSDDGETHLGKWEQVRSLVLKHRQTCIAGSGHPRFLRCTMPISNLPGGARTT